MHFNDRINPQAVSCPMAVEIEERIIGILMMFPEEYARCDSITAEDFVTDFSKRVFVAITDLYKENITDLVSLNETFSPQEISRIFDMKFRRQELTSNGSKALNEQIAALKKEKNRLNILRKDINSNDDLIDIIAKAKKDKGVGKIIDEK
ncbi:MAG: hypothetical protein J6K12_01810 [Clostridia bacterium]|nr:hypothetical protein [Clostridia bacterium]